MYWFNDAGNLSIIYNYISYGEKAFYDGSLSVGC